MIAAFSSINEFNFDFELRLNTIGSTQEFLSISSVSLADQCNGKYMGFYITTENGQHHIKYGSCLKQVVTTTTQATITKGLPTAADSKCHQSHCPDGIHHVPGDCRAFCKCSHGKAHQIQRCARGTVFNGQVCAWPHQVNCNAPHRRGRRDSDFSWQIKDLGQISSSNLLDWTQISITLSATTGTPLLTATVGDTTLTKEADVPDLEDAFIFAVDSLFDEATRMSPPADGSIKNVVFSTTKQDVHKCKPTWSNWSDCTVTCGGGTMTRTRFVNGVENVQDSACNVQRCKSKFELQPACNCSSGKYSCISKDCPRKHLCQKIDFNSTAMHCIPEDVGRCVSWGDPHIITYDGASIDVYGRAQYTLTQPNFKKFQSGHVNGVQWFIIMETMPFKRVAVGKRYELNVRKYRTDTEFDSYRVSTFYNGKTEYEFDIEGVNSWKEFEQYINLRKHGKQLTYETDFGLRFKHKGYYFSVNVPVAYRENNIEGLCCGFDFDKTNDLQEPDGTVHSFVQRGYKQTNSEFLTAKSWMIEGDVGPFPDVIAEDLKACVHQEMCDNMFNMPWLANCRKVVDTSKFIKSCKVDYCEDPSQETLEEIYETFIEDCKLALPEDDAVCRWRNELEFDQCPPGKVWSGCKSQCDVKNCDPTIECDETVTEAGCFCPDGKFEFDGRCVDTCPERQCSYQLITNERHIASGAIQNEIVGQVHYESQFVHQLDIKLNSLASGADWQNLIVAHSTELAADDVDLSRNCGRREPAIFIVKDSVSQGDGVGAGQKLLMHQCIDRQLDEAYDDNQNLYFSESDFDTAGVVVGTYQTWMFGQRRNPLSGKYELFIQVDGTLLRSWPNSQPLTFGEMNIWLGKTKENEWTSADFHVKNYVFHTSAFYQDIAHCTADKWAAWSRCSKTCGDGVRSRKGLQNGKVTVETETCENQPCEQWSNWSSCSASCGGGSRIRTRKNGDDPDEETEICQAQDCPSSINMCNLELTDVAQADRVQLGDKFQLNVEVDLTDATEFEGAQILSLNDPYLEKDFSSEIFKLYLSDNGKHANIQICLPHKGVEEETTEVTDSTEGFFDGGTFQVNFHFEEKTGPSDLVHECSETFSVAINKKLSLVLSKNTDSFTLQVDTDRQKVSVTEALIQPWVLSAQTSINKSLVTTARLHSGSLDQSLDTCRTEWTNWSQCTKTCGQGVKTKTRFVNHEQEVIEEKCTVKECLVEWGAWSEWSNVRSIDYYNY